MQKTQQKNKQAGNSVTTPLRSRCQAEVNKCNLKNATPKQPEDNSSVLKDSTIDQGGKPTQQFN